MCGIFGLVGRPVLRGLEAYAAGAMEAIAHRGPDGSGFSIFEGDALVESTDFLDNAGARSLENARVVLGHRRLAILDLSDAGRQPMGGSSGRFWITYNGEIYNYLELRAQLEKVGRRFFTGTDTEVILAAFAEWGGACVERFVGMWALAILDSRDQVLFFSRDRFGIKPFYYTLQSTCFAFGSEIKQFLALPGFDRRLNHQTVFDYLYSGSTDHAAATMFASVLRLQPGHNAVLDIRTGTLSLHKYYDPQVTFDRTRTIADAGAQFRELLTDSVRIHLRSDVEVGTCLSGGLDSSAIAVIASRILTESNPSARIKSFSSHFDEPEANERTYLEAAIGASNAEARFVNPTPSELQVDLHRLVWQQDEPFGSTSIFAQWSVFKLVGMHRVKVMLDGQGADELLAGYLGFFHTYFSELRAKQNWLRWWLERWRYAGLHLDTSVAAKILWLIGRSQSAQPGLAPWLNSQFERTYLPGSPWIRCMETKPYGDREQLANFLHQMIFSLSLPTLLRYEDRNSMAFSVEARVPYLDHRLVEFILRLPTDYKIHGGTTKHVMRVGLKGILPENIRLRTSKLGFATPERRWQAQHLRPMILEALQSNELEPFIMAPAARDNLAAMDRAQITSFEPWRWLNLYLWMRLFKPAG